MSPVIETERLRLRRPEPRDAGAMVRFLTSRRAAGIGGPHGAGRAWRSFAAELGHWDIHGFGMFAVTERTGDDAALGLVGPWFPIDWPETEIGWMMFEGAEGRGIAFEAARAAIDHAFGDLGWDTAVSYIAPDNARSIRLAERLGARRDPEAAVPDPDKPCLVYRHPRPATEARA